MLTNLSQLSQTINGKLHQYFTANDASIVECKEFLFQCLKYVGQVEDNIKMMQEQQAAAEAEKKAKEESVAVPCEECPAPATPEVTNG